MCHKDQDDIELFFINFVWSHWQIFVAYNFYNTLISFLTEERRSGLRLQRTCGDDYKTAGKLNMFSKQAAQY